MPKSYQSKHGQPIPEEWRRSFSTHAPESNRYALAWRTTTGGANATWTSLGDDRPLRVVEIEQPVGPKVYAIETDVGHVSPHELADTAWADCVDAFIEEKQKRRGDLRRIFVKVDFFAGDDPEPIGSCRKWCAPDPDKPESDDPADVWIGDAESEDDRRDRNLMREMRRERGQLFGMLTSALKMQNAQTEASAAMVEQLAGAFGRAFDVERKALADERMRLEELRQGDVDDRRTEMLFERLESFARMFMHQRGVGVKPNADGVDPLLADLRDLAANLSPEQWDALVAVNADAFGDLRTLLDRAQRYDAKREEMHAAAQAVFIEFARLGQSGDIDLPTVAGIIGPENIGRLNGIREHLQPPE